MEEKVVTKTIEEWFNELEEPYRTQAIENARNLNIDKDRLEDLADSMSDAIMIAFIWCHSPEGHEYWSDLFGKYLGE